MLPFSTRHAPAQPNEGRLVVERHHLGARTEVSLPVSTLRVLVRTEDREACPCLPVSLGELIRSFRMHGPRATHSPQHPNAGWWG